MADDPIELQDGHGMWEGLLEIVLAQDSMETVLERVALAAKQGISGVAEVSVTLLTHARPATAAFTGPLAIDLDETQYERGHGPCLEAARYGTTMLIPDVVAEGRWPRFTQLCAELGVRSTLSLHLPVQQRNVGALNIYSDELDNFGEGAVALAEKFAGYAAAALTNTVRLQAYQERAREMEQAMGTRAVIEQAKGIVMATDRCGPDAAFDALMELAQSSNRKLREIAQELVDETGRNF